MKVSLCFFLALLLPFIPAAAQSAAAPTPAYYAQDSLTRKGCTLLFISKDPALNATTKQRMMEAFFVVYPPQVQRFNSEARKSVTFIVDPEYKGVAAAHDGIVRCNPAWLREHPEDIDVVTHEVMHIVQAYPGGSPGWLTEGIADYVRYVYGVNNARGNWILPDYKAGQSYTNSYRSTARFLVWLEQNGHPRLVNELDKAARAATFPPQIWQQKTGKTLDELWASYVANPAVKLTYR